MLREKVFVFVITSLFLIPNSVSQELETHSVVQNYTRNSDVDSIVFFDDFSDFSFYDDFGVINSNNSNSTIEFHYDGGGGITSNATYVLPLDVYGNCTFFNITMKFNYVTDDIIDTVIFQLITGSYFDKNGNYINETDYIDPQKYVTYASIWDSTPYRQGYCAVVGYPNDEIDRYETPRDSLELSGNITQHLVRNESGTFSELFNTTTGELLLGNHWSLEDLYKPVNYLMLVFQSSGYDSKADLFAYDISANISIGNFEQDFYSPYIDFLSPEMDEVIKSDNITILWVGTDNIGIKKYSIRLDTEPWINKNLSTIHFFDKLTHGLHTISLYAEDYAGNSITIYRAFYVDLSITFVTGYNLLLTFSMVTIVICLLMNRKKIKK